MSEKEEFDILVELGALQREVKKVDRHIYNNYKKKIYKLEKKIKKAIEYNQKIYDTSTGNERLMAKINLDILRGEDNE